MVVLLYQYGVTLLLKTQNMNNVLVWQLAARLKNDNTLTWYLEVDTWKT